MKTKIVIIFILLINLFLISTAQHKYKSIFPFRKIFLNRDSLQLKEFRNANLYPIQKAEMDSLSNLQFSKRNIDVESLGVTPDWDISIYSGVKRIILLSIWNWTDSLYAVNVSINDKFMYHGLAIKKAKLKQLSAAIRSKSTSE
jgi:hypothetical protein